MTLITEAKELCDCICVDIEHRYAFTKQLLSAKLFNKKNFSAFKKRFPKNRYQVYIYIHIYIYQGIYIYIYIYHIYIQKVQSCHSGTA